MANIWFTEIIYRILPFPLPSCHALLKLFSRETLKKRIKKKKRNDDRVLCNNDFKKGVLQR